MVSSLVVSGDGARWWVVMEHGGGGKRLTVVMEACLQWRKANSGGGEVTAGRGGGEWSENREEEW